MMVSLLVYAEPSGNQISPCNLVHAWLYPLHDQSLNHAYPVDSIPDQVLMRACIARRPNLAPLLFGAGLTSLKHPICNSPRIHDTFVELDTAAWFDSDQSFFQNCRSQRPTPSGWMSRADVWRLFYVNGGYDIPHPPTPRKPFGEVHLQDVPARIRPHCRDHHLRYQQWSWELQDGSIFSRQRNRFRWHLVYLCGRNTQHLLRLIFLIKMIPRQRRQRVLRLDG